MKKSLLLLGIPLLLACGPFFYQAPPSIATYPERTPGKSWEQLLDTSYSPSDEKKGALIDECRNLVNTLNSSDNATIVASIENLQKRNRDGEFSIKIANFLIEFLELISADTDHTVLKPYLADRVENLRGGFLVIQEPEKTWRQTDEEYDLQVEEVRARFELMTSELELNIKEEPEALRPNFLVQRGAFLFRSGKSDLATNDFHTVISAFPDHPRAETAAFMLGRCALQNARTIKPRANNPSNEELSAWSSELDNANQSFLSYIEKYPDGRFVDDAEGWIGAVAHDHGDLATAFNQQLKRLDLQPTREVAYSVMREIDSLLDQILDERGESSTNSFYRANYEIDYDSMVKHPEIIQQFVYHALDPAAKIGLPYYSEDYQGGRRTIEFLSKKIVRTDEITTAGLHSLARAVAQSDTTPDKLSALVLSWSLIRANDPNQALVIIDRALEKVMTDDLLQARAVALSKLGRHADSVDQYRLLISEFSASPLAQGSYFDLAMELRRAGRAGEALIALLQFAEDDDTITFSPLHTSDEILQWTDTIAQFSPVEELRSALDMLPADSPQLPQLRRIVRTRLLCIGDFVAAKNYLDPPLPPDQIKPPYYPNQWNPKLWAHLDQERWDAEVEPLAKAQFRLAAANDDLLQADHLNAAILWKNLRGKVTLPLLSTFNYSNSESEKIDQLRRANARILGIDEKTITAQLDSRDELHHSLNHFLKAANGSDPHTTLTALFGTNEALFHLAEFSPYRLSRAVEENHTALSLKLVEQMNTEFANEQLTKSAIAFSFSPPATLREWMPGDYNPSNSDDYIDEAISGQDSFPTWNYDEIDDADEAAIREQFTEIRTTINNLANSPISDPQAVTESLRNRFTALRPKLAREEILSLVDNIDDLYAAAHTDGVTPELFRAYVPLRLTQNPKPTGELNWQPLMPFLDFIDNIRMVDVPDSYYQAHNADLASDWDAYLAKYPDGPKSEAAAFRRLRNVIRSIVPIPHVEAIHFPEAPIANGYKTIEIHVNPTSANPEMLIALIQDYRVKYPNGRYSMDVNLLEAAVLATAGNNAKALSLVTKVLDDPAHVEIRQDAALHFAAISLQLLNPEARSELIPAFRTTPNAMMYLERLANGNTCVSRVRPLIPALKAEK